MKQHGPSAALQEPPENPAGVSLRPTLLKLAPYDPGVQPQYVPVPLLVLTGHRLKLD